MRQMATLQRWWRSAALAIAAALMAGSADAQSAPGQQRGELLYEAHCIACHTAQVHWRAQRLVTNWPSLLHQVRRWQAIAYLAWTERDIADVARHRNQRYYHMNETAPPDRRRAGLHVGSGPLRDFSAKDVRIEASICGLAPVRASTRLPCLAWR